jgi:hypothetical protein
MVDRAVNKPLCSAVRSTETRTNASASGVGMV